MSEKTIAHGVQAPSAGDNQGAKGADKTTGGVQYVHGKRGLGNDNGSGVTYVHGEMGKGPDSGANAVTQKKGIKGQTGGNKGSSGGSTK